MKRAVLKIWRMTAKQYWMVLGALSVRAIFALMRSTSKGETSLKAFLPICGPMNSMKSFFEKSFHAFENNMILIAPK
jgi:hypothetical protein